MDPAELARLQAEEERLLREEAARQSLPIEGTLPVEPGLSPYPLETQDPAAVSSTDPGMTVPPEQRPLIDVDLVGAVQDFFGGGEAPAPTTHNPTAIGSGVDENINAPTPGERMGVGQGQSAYGDVYFNAAGHPVMIQQPEGAAGAGGGARIHTEQTLAPPGPYDQQIAEAGVAEGRARLGTAALEAEKLQEEARIAQEAAERESMAAERMDQLTREHSEAAQAKIQQLGGFLDAMGEQNIDPDRFFNTRGESARFGAAIAIAAGTMAQYMVPGTQNVPLQIINQAIERDVQAQVADMQNRQFVAGAQGNLLSQLRNNFADDRAAIAALRAIRAQEALNQLKVAQARAGSGQAMTSFHATAAQLQREVLTALNESFQRQHTTTFSTDIRTTPGGVAQYIATLQAQLRGEPVPAPSRGRGRGQPRQVETTGAVPGGYELAGTSRDGVPIIRSSTNPRDTTPPPGWMFVSSVTGQPHFVPVGGAAGEVSDTNRRELAERAGSSENDGRIELRAGTNRLATSVTNVLAQEAMWAGPGGQREALYRLRDIVDDTTGLSPQYFSAALAEADVILENSMAVPQSLRGAPNAMGESEAASLKAVFGNPNTFNQAATLARIDAMIRAKDAATNNMVGMIGGTWSPTWTHAAGQPSLGSGEPGGNTARRAVAAEDTPPEGAPHLADIAGPVEMF